MARLGWLLLGLGGPVLVAASALNAKATGAAASQDWPPFVLVTGLLLVGIVARDEGLFDLAGALIARVGRSGIALLASCSLLVALVTVTLNLDTSVTFVTPVVLAAARRQRRDLEPFAYLVVCMSNGASLLLPGSNLTNLIVLQKTRTSGAAFVAHVAAPWGASVVAVVLVVTVLFRGRITRADSGEQVGQGTARLGPGAFGVAGAVVAMVALSAPTSALVVAGIGLALAASHHASGRTSASAAARYVNVPLLLGLFSAACALGVLGRVWAGPSHLLVHLGPWQTAGVGAGSSIAVNNLPAASLLSAGPIAHPAALLIGLNLGPNLVVWGSLAGVLWFQASRAAGWKPSIRRLSVLGVAMVPATMAASLGALALTH